MPEWPPLGNAPRQQPHSPRQQPGGGPSGAPRADRTDRYAGQASRFWNPDPRHGDPTGTHSGGGQHRGVTPAASRYAHRPVLPRSGRSRRLDANRWHWLLFLPVVVALFPPLYNRTEPTLGGVPFYYWGQLSFALLASAVVTIVHLATKER